MFESRDLAFFREKCVFIAKSCPNRARPSSERTSQCLKLPAVGSTLMHASIVEQITVPSTHPTLSEEYVAKREAALQEYMAKLKAEREENAAKQKAFLSQMAADLEKSAEKSEADRQEAAADRARYMKLLDALFLTKLDPSTITGNDPSTPVSGGDASLTSPPPSRGDVTLSVPPASRGDATLNTKNKNSYPTMAPSTSKGDTSFGSYPTTSPPPSGVNETKNTTPDGTKPTVSAPAYDGDVLTGRNNNNEITGPALIHLRRGLILIL